MSILVQNFGFFRSSDMSHLELFAFGLFACIVFPMLYVLPSFFGTAAAVYGTVFFALSVLLEVVVVVVGGVVSAVRQAASRHYLKTITLLCFVVVALAALQVVSALGRVCWAVGCEGVVAVVVVLVGLCVGASEVRQAADGLSIGGFTEGAGADGPEPASSRSTAAAAEKAAAMAAAAAAVERYEEQMSGLRRRLSALKLRFVERMRLPNEDPEQAAQALKELQAVQDEFGVVNAELVEREAIVDELKARVAELDADELQVFAAEVVAMMVAGE